jgi:NAD(P)-dependent dehydrogenase (short-subunit alcohol dehydrogenase family)
LILCHDACVEQLDGKVAVVTGAGSGIGRALVARFAAEGMRVIGADVEPEALADTAADVPDLETFMCDVSDYEEVAALCDFAYASCGSVDVLCNNAGVFVGGALWERSAEDFEWVLGVNLWGILNAIRAFVPRMITAGTPAHIVNTSSMAGLTTNAVSGPYTISKHAALSATECLAHDLAMAGAPIKVSAVVPGAVDTRIGSSHRNRPAELGGKPTADGVFADQVLSDFTRAQGAPPEDVADMILDAIRTEQFLVPTKPSYAQQIRDRADALIEKRLPPGANFD